MRAVFDDLKLGYLRGVGRLCHHWCHVRRHHKVMLSGVIMESAVSTTGVSQRRAGADKIRGSA